MYQDQNKIASIHCEASAYYADKILTYGPSPEGVDWNGEQGQALRFAQLAKILPSTSHWVLADIGCGYGAMLSYLIGGYPDKEFQYVGTDISQEMLDVASVKARGFDNATFYLGDIPPHTVDYSVASGIFNVKQGRDNEEWLSYIKATLSSFNDVSEEGFAFNALTVYSDREKMKSNLYYADPLFLFDFCKRNFSRNVAVLHDYGLYEFTILVRKMK
jgi:SAM-dependent methyltransferase